MGAGVVPTDSYPSMHSEFLFAAIAAVETINLHRSCHRLSSHQFSPTIIDLNYYCFFNKHQPRKRILDGG